MSPEAEQVFKRVPRYAKKAMWEELVSRRSLEDADRIADLMARTAELATQLECALAQMKDERRGRWKAEGDLEIAHAARRHLMESVANTHGTYRELIAVLVHYGILSADAVQAPDQITDAPGVRRVKVA